MPGAVAVFAAAAGPAGPIIDPSAVDLTAVGLLMAAVSALARLWWLERRAADEARAVVLELTRSTVTATTEAAASMRSTADALDRLTDEVRRRP